MTRGNNPKGTPGNLRPFKVYGETGRAPGPALHTRIRFESAEQGAAVLAYLDSLPAGSRSLELGRLIAAGLEVRRKG